MAGALNNDMIGAEILRLTGLRGPEKSICPSEVARSLRPDAWQPLLSEVRRTAARLSVAGQVEILRKGKPVPPEDMRGVIRLRAVAP